MASPPYGRHIDRSLPGDAAIAEISVAHGATPELEDFSEAVEIDGSAPYPLPITATHSISTSSPSWRSLGEVTAVEAGMLPVNASDRPFEYSA